MATTNNLLQIIGILSWCKQDEKRPWSQDFKTVLAQIIRSEQSESKPGAFSGFRCCRAAVNSLEMFTVGAFQSSDNSLKISQDDLQSTFSYLPFLISWDAMASKENAIHRSY